MLRGFRNGARKRTRTSTTVRPLAPEASASASSAIRAQAKENRQILFWGGEVRLSTNRRLNHASGDGQRGASTLFGAGTRWARVLMPPADGARSGGGDHAVLGDSLFVVMPGSFLGLRLWFRGGGRLRVRSRGVFVVAVERPPMRRSAGDRADGTENECETQSGNQSLHGTPLSTFLARPLEGPILYGSTCLRHQLRGLGR